MKFLCPSIFLALYSTIQAYGCPPTEENASSPAPPAVQASNKVSATLTAEEKKHPFNLLVFGGGYSPSGNQVSLESNVKYFRRIRSSMGLGEAAMKTYFADGKSKDRDLQFFDPSFRIPEVNQIMAELLGSSRGIANQYRGNDLQADDSSSLVALDKWLNERKKQGGKQTNLIYFTGHGGKGDKKTPHNTTAYLWNNAKLKVADFVKKLDQLPKDQPCIFVMVQCYSGGFANVIFKDGDPKKGLSEHARAGFFATVKNRVAAGCTPDIREKNYREYSTRFWEGLCGESRVGKKIKKPDFDKDGKTSLAEAHAFVILKSDTIDIPIKTSDVFLRRFSSLTPPKDTNKTSSLGSKTSSVVAKLPKETKSEETKDASSCAPDDLFHSVTEELKGLLKGTGVESRAIVNGLSRKLKLTQPNRHEEAKKLIVSLKKNRASILEQKKKHDEERGKIKRSLSTRLRNKWPELKNLHHPTVTSLYRNPKAAQVKELVDGDGSWTRYKELSGKSKKLESERFLLEKKEVLVMRLIRELETIVLTKNLPLINPPHIVGSYEKLTELEHTILPGPKPIANN
jgi:hypothetical protein